MEPSVPLPSLSLEEAIAKADLEDVSGVLVHGAKIESPVVKEEDIPKPKVRGRPRKVKPALPEEQLVEVVAELKKDVEGAAKEGFVVRESSLEEGDIIPWSGPKSPLRRAFEDFLCNLCHQHPIDVLVSGILLGVGGVFLLRGLVSFVRSVFSSPALKASEIVPLDEPAEIILLGPVSNA